MGAGIGKLGSRRTRECPCCGLSSAAQGVTDTGHPGAVLSLSEPLSEPLSPGGAESGELVEPALSHMEILPVIPFPGTAPAPPLDPKHGNSAAFPAPELCFSSSPRRLWLVAQKIGNTQHRMLISCIEISKIREKVVIKIQFIDHRDFADDTEAKSGKKIGEQRRKK